MEAGCTGEARAAAARAVEARGEVRAAAATAAAMVVEATAEAATAAAARAGEATVVGAPGEAPEEVAAPPVASMAARAAPMGTAARVAATAAEGWAEGAVGVRAAAAREVAATVAGSRCSIHRKSVGKHGDRGASAGAQTARALPHVWCDSLAYVGWIANAPQSCAGGRLEQFRAGSKSQAI